MTAETMAAWLLATMTAVHAPGQSKVTAETLEQGEARYGQIAHAIASVASDPDEAPLFGAGSRPGTAALLLALSFMESGWRRDIDLGIGPWAKGDGGRSCGLFQALVGTGKTLEGYSCKDLVSDREKATRAALHAVRRSKGACREAGAEAMLRVYASGDCGRGIEDSRARVQLARRWMQAHPPPKEVAPK